MKFADLNLNELERTLRLDRDSVRLLWHDDFYDGPISGMLSYLNCECWFQWIAESKDEDSGWYRRYVLLRLTSEQIAEESRWHDLFRMHVGGHTDYSDGSDSSYKDLKPKEQWVNFYEPYNQRKPRDFAECEILGWFEL